MVRSLRFVTPFSGSLRTNMTRRSEPQVMTIDELAKYLRLSKSTLYKLCQKHEIPGQKIGRHWRFLRDEINQWLRTEDEK